jgi:hypothetical protein
MAEVGEERVSVGAVPSGGSDRYSDGVDEEEDYNDESFSAEEPEPPPPQVSAALRTVGAALPTPGARSLYLSRSVDSTR